MTNFLAMSFDLASCYTYPSRNQKNYNCTLVTFEENKMEVRKYYAEQINLTHIFG